METSVFPRLIRLASCILASGIVCCAAQTAATNAAAGHASTVTKYCATCHSDKLRTGGLTLESANLGNIPPQGELWEKVIRKLRTGAMPPAGAPRPDKATSNALASYLENAIDSAAVDKLNPGTPTLHRLNRTEYANAVRVLLAVEVDPETLLPRDDAGYGFD